MFVKTIVGWLMDILILVRREGLSERELSIYKNLKYFRENSLEYSIFTLICVIR